MQFITIAGRLGKDAQTNSPNGKSVCNFSVAVDQGFGQNKSTNWFRCAIWGKRGETLGQYLTKGTQVSVVGALRIGEYNGKPQFDVDVAEITLQGGGQQGGGSGSDYGSRSEPAQDDLDSDDIPFISSSTSDEVRCF